LRCADSSLYTGITKDLMQRLVAHNAGQGARYTRAHLPVTLVWSKAGLSGSAARQEEARIKRRRALKVSVAGSQGLGPCAYLREVVCQFLWAA